MLNPDMKDVELRIATQPMTKICFFARFVATKEMITINRATKLPVPARILPEVSMWDENRLSDALKYQGFANRMIDQIEIVRGTLTLQGDEVVKEPDKITIKVGDK